jgi:hypothetical protein
MDIFMVLSFYFCIFQKVWALGWRARIALALALCSIKLRFCTISTWLFFTCSFILQRSPDAMSVLLSVIMIMTGETSLISSSQH